MKSCRVCKIEKILEKFVKNKLSKAGIDSICLDCSRQRVKLWRKKNPNKRKLQNQKYAKKHPEILNAKRQRHNTKKLLACPKWANIDKIKEVYKNCPKGMQVDHIIPLQGKIVSGLHVHYNLQYLTAKENQVKGNRY